MVSTIVFADSLCQQRSSAKLVHNVERMFHNGVIHRSRFLHVTDIIIHVYVLKNITCGNFEAFADDNGQYALNNIMHVGYS